MKTTPFALLAFTLVMVGASNPAAVAAACGDSFYCYGDTAKSVVGVPTRPPPIPPPSHHLMRQRNQAQLAMRTHTTHPAVTTLARPPVAVHRPAPQPVVVHRPAPAPVAVHRPAPQPVAVHRPAPPPVVVYRPAPPPFAVRRPAPPRRVSSCPYPAMMGQAGWMESQAVIASTHGDRAASVRLFRDAAQLRQRAARLGCR